ncbi:MAG: hypothetical protein ACON4T_07345 [Synechococcus sp.]
MKPSWSDGTVLVALVLTVLVVFALAFSLRPSDPDGPPLLWRTPALSSGNSLQI